MLPARWLELEPAGDALRPRFVSGADIPWLEHVVDTALALAGRPWRQLEDQLALDLAAVAEERLRQIALHRLRALAAESMVLPIDPRRARERLFTAAAGIGRDRDRAIAVVTRELAVEEEALFDALFADIAGERLVGPLPLGFGAQELRLHMNFAIAEALLGRASRVLLRLRCNARGIVRHAQRTGLICLARQLGPDVLLEISGPFAVIRHTRVYQRALASLLPHLAGSPGFILEASWGLEAGRGCAVLESSNPIFPASAPVAGYDSLLEERFARDFDKLGSTWELLREPEPVSSGDSVVFPDFVAVSRRTSGRRWFIEILGYWTESYLERKLSLYRQAAIADLLLLVDEGRRMDNNALPPHARVVRFRRRVDTRAVLAVLESPAEAA